MTRRAALLQRKPAVRFVRSVGPRGRCRGSGVDHRLRASGKPAFCFGLLTFVHCIKGPRTIQDSLRQSYGSTGHCCMHAIPSSTAWVVCFPSIGGPGPPRRRLGLRTRLLGTSRSLLSITGQAGPSDSSAIQPSQQQQQPSSIPSTRSKRHAQSIGKAAPAGFRRDSAESGTARPTRL